MGDVTTIGWTDKTHNEWIGCEKVKWEGAMSQRLNTAAQQFILREMLELARFLTKHSVPPLLVKEAVKRLREDLMTLLRAGVDEITVDQASYLPAATDQSNPHQGSTSHESSR